MNWAGNVAYGARSSLEPRSIDALQAIVRAAASLRVVGSRHSFSEIVATPGDIVSLARLPRVFELDPTSRTVTVDGAVTYGELARRLDAERFALHNLASLPHISVAGACATGTHGSGDRLGGLATSVVRIDLVTADGEIRSLERGRDADAFAGAVVALGALGVAVRLTLAVEPAYSVRQEVFEDLSLEAGLAHFDEITASADSVSLFTRWRAARFEQVWLKTRVTGGEPFEPRPDLFGARPARVNLHPIPGLSADACTPQLGVAGPWHERLPHFRMDFTPSSGNELQSEYLVDRRDAADALLAIDGLRDRIPPHLQVSEIRTIAPDELWLSPAYGRASVAIHFTWLPDWPAVSAVLPAIEAALGPFGPRPHWGKLFALPAETLGRRYPRLGDFTDLAARLDPDGVFRNPFLDRHVFGTRARP